VVVTILSVFTIVFSYVFGTLLPEPLEYDTASTLLTTIIDVCGVLVGFAGIMVVFQLTSADKESKGQTQLRSEFLVHQNRVLVGSIAMLLFFIFSILTGVLGLASLAPKNSTELIKWSTFFMIAGVSSLFWLHYLQSQARK